MKQAFFIIFTLITAGYWNCPTSVDAFTKDDLYNLTSFLFSGYNNEVRPTTAGEATHVYVDVYLVALVNLDEKSQELETSIVLEAWWNDDYLQWDEATYGGITHLHYRQEKVWLPDVIIENSVDRQRQMGYDDNRVLIMSSGNIFWKPSELVKTGCDIDVTYYPFDTQTCNIIISSWMSNRNEVHIDPDKDTTGMILDRYSPSGTWDLIENTFQELSDSDGLSRIQFTLKFRRLKTYYILNLILPLLYLSFTASMVFLLPCDSGEKIGLSITVLLAYAVYLTIVAEDIPHTSLQVAFLEIYLTTLLGLTALSVVLTVIVLHIYNKPQRFKIGPRTQGFTRTMRRILWPGDHHDLNQSDTSSDGRRRSAFGKSHKVTPLEKDGQRTLTPAESDGEIDQEEEEEITWKLVAETVDRICFIVCTSCVLLITFVFLIVIATGEQ